MLDQRFDYAIYWTANKTPWLGVSEGWWIWCSSPKARLDHVKGQLVQLGTNRRRLHLVCRIAQQRMVEKVGDLGVHGGILAAPDECR